MGQLGHPTCREKASKPPPLPGSEPPHPHLPSAGTFPGNIPQFLLFTESAETHTPLSFIPILAVSNSWCGHPPPAVRHPALDAKQFLIKRPNFVNEMKDQVKNFPLLMGRDETSSAGGGGQCPAPPFPHPEIFQLSLLPPPALFPPLPHLPSASVL